MSVSRQFGMTAPISTAGPDASDLDRTLALEEALKPHGVFETDGELEHRMNVLKKLNELVQDWIRDLVRHFYLIRFFSFYFKLLCVFHRALKRACQPVWQIQSAVRFTLLDLTDWECTTRVLISTLYVSLQDTFKETTTFRLL